MSMAALAGVLVGPSPGPSRLTAGGGPVELAFATGSSRPGLTVEPRPGAGQPERWRAVVAALGAEGLADPRLGDGFVADLAAQPDLRFGMFLGVRGSGPGGAPLRCKLYQEVAGAGRVTVAEALGDRLPPAWRSLRPRLVGTVLAGPVAARAAWPGKPEREWYFALEGWDRGSLHRLLAPVGHGRRLPYVLDCLAMLASEPVGELPQRLRLGISISHRRAGSVPAVTIYAHSQELFASDAEARIGILGLCRELGRPLAGYSGASARLGPGRAGPGPARVHGLVGLEVDGGDGPAVAVGLCPRLAAGRAGGRRSGGRRPRARCDHGEGSTYG